MNTAKQAISILEFELTSEQSAKALAVARIGELSADYEEATAKLRDLEQVASSLEVKVGYVVHVTLFMSLGLTDSGGAPEV